jgi:predicted Zn-dependent protease
MLKRVSDRGGQRLPGFLSTHPDPGDRETRTRELARAAVVGHTGLRVNARSYVQRLEGVVYGNDPREGYFEGPRFYHPTLGFQLAFPADWKIQNTHTAVAAAEPGGKAQMQLTLESAGAFTPSQYFADLQTRGAIAAAEGGAESIGGYPAWVGRLRVNRQDGTAAVLAAAGIRKADDQFFRMLGQSATPGDANESAILVAARSFRPLTDPARVSVTPARVQVLSAPRTGAFRDVVAGLGAMGADLEEISILNNVQVDEEIHAGEVLKVVRAGRK